MQKNPKNKSQAFCAKYSSPCISTEIFSQQHESCLRAQDSSTNWSVFGKRKATAVSSVRPGSMTETEERKQGNVKQRLIARYVVLVL